MAKKKVQKKVNRGANDGKMGRPIKPATLTFEQAIDAMAPWYTQEHIARELGISIETLTRKVKELYNCTFMELRDIKRDQTFSRLARVQIEVACEDKNPTMLVWLGKQYLKQTDKQEIKSDNTHKIESLEDYLKSKKGK